jgi:uncharacterized protein (TIGR02118 family)
MICVTVFYPNSPDRKFDHDYYVKTHMPLCLDRLKNHGVVRFEVDRGLGGQDPQSPAPFVCMGRLYFTTLEGFQEGMRTHGAEIRADIANYTDITPNLQVSQNT